MNTTTNNGTRLYSVFAWKGMECVWFRTGNQARTVARHAAHGALDLNADRIVVHREGEESPAATWQATGGWKFGPTCDPRLKALLEEGGL